MEVHQKEKTLDLAISQIEKQFSIRLDIDDVMNVNSPNDFIKLVNELCKSK